ncbi:photosystem II repair protein PSB27-H1, chloroplastic [Nymphaea colorata]|uniref:photosystem II repair protein PSB27-H1, chloroplastic n=1 Tax=Nymphaea colorata TaxID=210225 RepID=UPI00129E0EA1|nr:photosystem II repair protein PSB27-H1, chloroplastic [Nymphaea colorata]
MSTTQSLFTPTSHLKLLPPTTSVTTASTTSASPNHLRPTPASSSRSTRRTLLTTSTAAAAASLLLVLREPPPAHAASDDEYKKETSEVIGKLRTTLGLDRSDPNVASAVAELREASTTWVAKYRREKELLGRSSFRDMYSALNAVSGHYISFGPTAPIPAKRKARILEEVDSAEKALLRGR